MADDCRSDQRHQDVGVTVNIEGAAVPQPEPKAPAGSRVAGGGSV